MTPRFAERLGQEFARRRAANPRYSLRAFAKFLGLEHSSLSQILRGRRAVPPAKLSQLARRLGLGPEETAAYVGAARIPGDAWSAAQEKRRSWLGEAAALMQAPAHWHLLSLVECADWLPDMRSAAERTGCSVDSLNEAGTRLLRLGLIRVDDRGFWRLAPELRDKDLRARRELALARLRETSAA